MRRSGILLLSLICFLLGSLATPAEAGYTRDTCAKSKTGIRVRGDLVFDMETGKIFIEKNAKTQFHPASLTKLMSLALIFEDLQKKRLKPNDMIPLIRTGGQLDGRTASIKRMTAREAVDGIATASLNNVLDGIAAREGTGIFVRRMNDLAKGWGMTKTFYVNPTGWPTAQSTQMQRTTLYDLATLVRRVWLGYPKEVAQYAGKKEITITGLKKPLRSTNNLLAVADGPHAQPYEGVIGGKTGYTCPSGWHLVTIYEDPQIKRRMVAMTVGHATGKARDDQMKKLLDSAKPKLIAFDKAEKRRIEQERIAAAKAEAKRKADEAKAKQLAAQKLAEENSRKVVVQTVTTTTTTTKRNPVATR